MAAACWWRYRLRREAGLPATRCGLFRRRSLGITISRLHIANDHLAALTYENMLDPHVLLRAAPEAPLDLNLHRESRQQANSQPIQALRRAIGCHPHRLSEQAPTSPPNGCKANRGLRH